MQQVFVVRPATVKSEIGFKNNFQQNKINVLPATAATATATATATGAAEETTSTQLKRSMNGKKRINRRKKI